MPTFSKKPRGLMRLGFRLPIWLYRLHLGWVFGERLLLLRHIGRKSGLPRQTVVEVVRHDQATDTYFVASGYGEKADWFQNIRHNPNVAIMVKNRTIAVRARFLSESDGAQELQDYAKRYPMAFRELSKMITGKAMEGSSENCRQFAQHVPLIAFEPRTV